MKRKQEDITARLRHGDRLAQRDFYRQHVRQVYSTCLRITGNRFDAEEATQDAFLRMFHGISSFEGRSDITLWIRNIAVRCAIDTIRSRTDFCPFDDNMDMPDECEEQELTECEAAGLDVQLIKRAMTRLPEGYRAVLSLLLFEGYDREETAEILHLKPSTVRTQYIRGKKRLLDIIAEIKNNG